MEPAPAVPDLDLAPQRERARRGIALIAASAVAITLAGIGFLHPALPSLGGGTLEAGQGKQAAYRVVATDFVDGKTGWVVALFPSGDYALLHTSDGARTWARQLTVSGDSHPFFVKFFDRSAGVFGLIGTYPLLRRTSDGGRTWSALPALSSSNVVVSWSFAAADLGWMLSNDTRTGRPARLYRTRDGGQSWTDLGPPVSAPDRAFRVNFSATSTGWLTTSSGGAYAYRSDDQGVTWARVPLPAPAGGWSGSGEFFVGVQPTFTGGAVASVVYFPPIKGRTGIGGTIRAFPPLTIRGFDGGRPHTYLYATLMDQLVGGPLTQDQAPNQVELSSLDYGESWKVITPPSTAGAIGFFDASNWWWVTAGLWSKSKDGGATWSEPRGAGVVDPLPGTLRVLDGSHAWLAGSGSSKPVVEGTEDGGVTWRLLSLPAIEDVPTP